MNLGMMKIGQREYPVAGYVTTKQTGTVPLVGAPMIDGCGWHMLCLKSRLEHPEWYADHEDVEAKIARLREILTQYGEEGRQLTLTEAG